MVLICYCVVLVRVIDFGRGFVLELVSVVVPVLAIDNASGDSYLLKYDNSSAWTVLSSSGLGIRGVDNTTGIDLLINSDDSKFGVLESFRPQ